MAHVLINVTQLAVVRQLLLEKANGLLVSLLPLLNSPNEVVRQGIVGILKNLCHEAESLPWILGGEVALLDRVWRLINGRKTETDESVWVLTVDLLVVVASSAPGMVQFRAKCTSKGGKDVACRLRRAQRCPVVASLPRKTQDSLAQLVSKSFSLAAWATCLHALKNRLKLIFLTTKCQQNRLFFCHSSPQTFASLCMFGATNSLVVLFWCNSRPDSSCGEQARQHYGGSE